nr:MAG TPA: hypothetical protein [Caudoviricetes sp.]
MIDYKRYVILLGFDNTIKSSKEVFPFLMSGTDLNNALRHFLDLECGIPFHKTDNLTTYELTSKIPQMVLSIYELKPDNMIYFGDNKNEPTNKDEPESIKDVKTAPVIVKDTYGNDVMLYENNSQT